MLLKSQTIIKQEELVSILEAQLKKAKSRLTELTKADTKIKSVVAELESLLTEHPDYKLLVSDRLKLGESEAGNTGPVRIEIEQELDQLDTLTEKLDSASEYKLKFGRIGNTVAVGYGNKMIGKYGLSDSQIWRDTFLSDYLIKEHGIQFDDLKRELNSETTPQDVLEAYDSLFGEAPPQNTPHTEKIEKIESPYSSGAEIAQLIEAHDQLSQRNQPTEQEISAWDSEHEQVQSVVLPIQSDDEEEKIALVEKVLSELDTFEFSKTRGIPKIAMYIEIKGKSLGMIFTDKKDLVSTIELEENLIRTYALDLPLLLKDVNEGKSITLDNYCLSKKSEVGEVQQQSKPTIEQMKQQLLSKATRAELDTFKANIGETNLKEIWELCSIPERNQIKCISQAKVAKRVPATLGYKFQYTAPITKAKYEAIYLGYYLHGQPVEKDNERVIFVEGRAIICTKDDLRPCREQPGISEDERARLEAIISEPLSDMDFEVFVGKFKKLYLEERRRQELEGVVAIRSKEICQKFAQNHNISESLLQEYFDKLKSDGLIFAVQENNKELFQWIDEQPTANDIASNTFTGLQPAQKQNGSVTGKQQDFSQSEQSDVVQTELYLKVEQPAPSKKTEVIPTPLLETVAGEIKKVNPELTFGYDSNGKSTFLTVYHGTSYIGIFEDDGVDLYSSNTAKMLHHGFTEEMIDALIEIELSPKV
ncbi:hypothetical protein [Okeania sp. SIO1I7]|uniref:hypothetical protein n=1 Tax=Okeania sp. SIO1I7 TaxID=2607772 RepID=UPI0013F8464C|nr:hypothetical protein [Okeania sp. SIO1I7]NET30060.1 hypothetical protein [Okeania sp. SIO1I7]